MRDKMIEIEEDDGGGKEERQKRQKDMTLSEE